MALLKKIEGNVVFLNEISPKAKRKKPNKAWPESPKPQAHLIPSDRHVSTREEAVLTATRHHPRKLQPSRLRHPRKRRHQLRSTDEGARSHVRGCPFRQTRSPSRQATQPRVSIRSFTSFHAPSSCLPRAWQRRNGLPLASQPRFQCRFSHFLHTILALWSSILHYK